MPRFDEEYMNNMEHRMTEKRGLAMGLRRPVSYTLTEDEISKLKEEAKSIGIPVEKLLFNQGRQTGFRDRDAMIYIRGDVLPDMNSVAARDRMSSRAVLAHEYYGHYKNHPSEYPRGYWMDEFRASYDAAVNAPNLSSEDRRNLMLDAYDRAKEAGETIEMTDEARRIIYGF